MGTQVGVIFGLQDAGSEGKRDRSYRSYKYRARIKPDLLLPDGGIDYSH